MTPWYHRSEVLDILEQLHRIGPNIRVATSVEHRPVTSERTQFFADGFLSSLDAWRALTFGTTAYSRVTGEMLTAAVTGVRLCGVHFLGDEPELRALADEIAGLLRSARFHAGRVVQMEEAA